MKKELNIILLLTAGLALSSNVAAQQHTGHSDHEQHGNMQSHSEMEHAEHDHSDHGHHDQHGHSEAEHAGHEHSGHAMDHHADHSGHGGHDHHDHGDHYMDYEGTMIMGQNFDKLPNGCTSISEEREITVRAGRKYAEKFPGTVFAFDQQEWQVKPCSKVTFHFVNEDSVRHQFMVHGLPRYLYNQGMFHLEVTGPKTVSGTLIMPVSDDTLLAHCDISHHMEKGMKAQLVIGKGAENMPSIPGLTPYNIVDVYEMEDFPKASDKDEQREAIREITKSYQKGNTQNYIVAFLGLLVGLFSIPLILRLFGRKSTNSTE